MSLRYGSNAATGDNSSQASCLRLVPRYTPTSQDLDLEAELLVLMDTIKDEPSEAKRAYLWFAYSQLHASRSPEMVAFMESQKGIHRG